VWDRRPAGRRRAFQDASQAFLKTVAQPCSKRTLESALGLGAVAFILFAALAPNALETGDAATYAQSIATGNLGETTIHLGYYLLGIVVTPLIPLPADRSLNIVSAACGGLSVLSIFLIAHLISGKKHVALVATLLLLTHDMFIRHALYAEVYLPQTSFLLLAILLWLRNRPILTGAAFAMSVLITPSAVFAVPCLVILRPQRRALSLMGLTAAALLVIAILPNYQDFFFGPRNLLRASRAAFSPIHALNKEGVELLFGFFASLPLITCGIVAAAVRPRFRVPGLAVASLWLVSLLLGERFTDVPVQLPTYAVLCLLGGLGFSLLPALPRKRRWARLLPLLALLSSAAVVLLIRCSARGAYVAANLPLSVVATVVVLALPLVMLSGRSRPPRRQRILSVAAVVAAAAVLNTWIIYARGLERRNDVVAFRDTVMEMHRIADPDYVAISEWSRGILFEHYVFGRSYTDHWINMEWLRGEWGEQRQSESAQTLRRAVDAGTELWLFRPYPELETVLVDRGYRIEPYRTLLRATLHNSEPTNDR